MSFNPIVQEVREAGERFAAETGNDVHRFFEKLRETQAGYAKPLVREPVSHYETASKTTQSS